MACCRSPSRGRGGTQLSGSTLNVPVGPFLGAGKIIVTGTANGFPALKGSLTLGGGAGGRLVLKVSAKACRALATKGKLKVATSTTVSSSDYGVAATKAKKEK